MRRFALILALVFLASSAAAQTNGGTGSALPGTCVTGSLFVRTDSGQIQICAPTNNWLPSGASAILAKATSVNLNAVADTAITVAATKYIVRKFVVTNCSGTPVLAQVALYTGAGASGTTVVTAAVITALTGATKFVDMTIAAIADTLSAATLYVRNAVVQGSALTCDVYLLGDVLP